MNQPTPTPNTNTNPTNRCSYSQCVPLFNHAWSISLGLAICDNASSCGVLPLEQLAYDGQI